MAEAGWRSPGCQSGTQAREAHKRLVVGEQSPAARRRVRGCVRRETIGISEVRTILRAGPRMANTGPYGDGSHGGRRRYTTSRTGAPPPGRAHRDVLFPGVKESARAVTAGLTAERMGPRAYVYIPWQS